MATLGGTDLGKIQTETQDLQAGLFEQPLPLSPSASTLLLDLFGTVRNVTIQGRFTGTVAQIRTFISTMDGYANGAQTARAFQSDLISSTINVFIRGFSWTYNQADVLSITYTLTLVQGAAIS